MKLQTPGWKVESIFCHLNRKQSSKCIPSIVKSMNFGARLFGLKSQLYHLLDEWSCCCLVVSNSLCPNGLQPARVSSPSLSPKVCPNSCPLNHWRYPTISSSVAPFSCLQFFPASGSFQMSQHQVAKVLAFQLQHQSFQWIFRTDLL